MAFIGDNLRCVRGGRIVFEGLAFELKPGKALLLTGPNGSGKSSLLRLMAGLTRPDAGTLTWDGEAIGAEPEMHAARLAYVGHLDAVKTALTVRENLAQWSGDGGAIDGAVARFGLNPALPARLLSAGQKRRLALARLIARPAPLWLLDEPTVSLDRDSVANLMALIAAHRAGGGMCAVSTNVDLALTDADVLDLTTLAPA